MDLSASLNWKFKKKKTEDRKKGDEVILYSYHDNTNVVHFFHLNFTTTRKT